MKALTVRQPWASLIMKGGKDVENRTWRTCYRGPLAIHAGRHRDHYADITIAPAPLGVILGVITLIDVVTDHPSAWAQPGAWHWLLVDPVSLHEPVKQRGRPGLWDCAIDVATLCQPLRRSGRETLSPSQTRI